MGCKSASVLPVDTNMSLKKIDYLPFLESCWQEHLQPKPDNAPTVISTFSGCGGSTLGYSMAGFRELLAIEWDKNAVDTFRLNFDIPVIFGDIAEVSVEQVLEMTGLQPSELDILDGSPPCQGFSTAGKRQLDDPRNQLFREYVRLLRGLKPKVFVMENVSGMVKGIMKLVFVEILKELKASGYKVSAKLLNAMYFNVPQSRQRMIFIGVREDLGIEPSHPEGENLPVTVRQALFNIIDDSPVPPKLNETSSVAKLMRTCLPGKSLGSSGNKGKYYSWIKASFDKPCPTIPKSVTWAGYSIWHPIEERSLSGREMARISSYFDKYIFIGKHSDWVARIGNSVPPLFMRSIARHIRTEILDGRATS